VLLPAAALILKKTRAVRRHCGLCHFTLKSYLKAKEELWKTQNISPCKNIIFPKKKKKSSRRKPKSFKIL
jgi:hypothetical protein